MHISRQFIHSGFTITQLFSRLSRPRLRTQCRRLLHRVPQFHKPGGPVLFVNPNCPIGCLDPQFCPIDCKGWQAYDKWAQEQGLSDFVSHMPDRQFVLHYDADVESGA